MASKQGAVVDDARNPIQTRYEALMGTLSSRDVFDTDINSVRARSLAISAAVDKVHHGQKKKSAMVPPAKNANSQNGNTTASEQRSPSRTTAGRSHSTTASPSASYSKRLQQMNHGKGRNSGGVDYADADEASGGLLSLRRTMQTPYLSAERRFIDDLNKAVEEGTAHALNTTASPSAASKQQQQAFVAFAGGNTVNTTAMGNNTNNNTLLNSSAPLGVTGGGGYSASPPGARRGVTSSTPEPTVPMGRAALLQSNRQQQQRAHTSMGFASTAPSAQLRQTAGSDDDDDALLYNGRGVVKKNDPAVGFLRGESNSPSRGRGGNSDDDDDDLPPRVYGGRGTSSPPCPPIATAVSGVLQKAIEHIRYPEAESRLRNRLKKQYDAAHRSQNVVERYFSTENINPSATKGLGVATGATKNAPIYNIGGGGGGNNSTATTSHNSVQFGGMGMMMGGQMMLGAPARKPGAAPIADGTANPRIITAAIDFNALHEEELMKKYGAVGGVVEGDGNDGAAEKKPASRPSSSPRGGKKKGAESDDELNTTASKDPSRGTAAAASSSSSRAGTNTTRKKQKALQTQTADAIFSRLDPQSLIKGAERTHQYREILRARTDDELAEEEGLVLVEGLRTAHAFRPGAKGGPTAHLSSSDDDEHEDNSNTAAYESLFNGTKHQKDGTKKGAALSRKSRLELQEAMERSNALRTIFSKESDSDDDRGDDTEQQNDAELLRTGAMRREARDQQRSQQERRAAAKRAKFGDLSTALGGVSLLSSQDDGNGKKNGSGGAATTTQDTIEDLCDLLECCIMSFCEYMHRSTVLGGRGSGKGPTTAGAAAGAGGGNGSSNALFASGSGGGYEGPPRDISILRSILIHALSSSLPQLKQALHVLGAIQLGTGGAHTMILEDPLSITAVAVSGSAYGGGGGESPTAGNASLLSNGSSSVGGANASVMARMSGALKTVLRERQQELRFRLFRSWTKAFEVLLSLDLRHENSTAGILTSLAAKAAAAAAASATSPMHASVVAGLGGDTSIASINTGIPEGFTVHNDLHMRRAAAYYCSLHRGNAERREFLMALWRENKKKFESALLQGREVNPFHQARPDWEEPQHEEANAAKGRGGGNTVKTLTSAMRNAVAPGNGGALVDEDGGGADDPNDATTSTVTLNSEKRPSHVVEKHLQDFTYSPYPLDVAQLEALTPSQQHMHRRNQAKMDELVDYFANTKRVLQSEDLSLLDFNSANIIYKQKQLASAFLDRLLPKILGSTEYRTSVAGVAGAMAGASAVGNGGGGKGNGKGDGALSPAKASDNLRPIDKFRRVLLRYANLAGHDASNGGANVEAIDEEDATRVDALRGTIRPHQSLNRYDGHHGSGAIADLSIGPMGSQIVPDTSGGTALLNSTTATSSNTTTAANTRSLEEHMAANPAATAKLMSVFRNSWGRTALTPSVQESEAIIRASVLEDTLLINVMDAYFHLLSDPLQQQFLAYVREEKKRHSAASAVTSGNGGGAAASPAVDGATASAVVMLMDPSTLARNKALGASVGAFGASPTAESEATKAKKDAEEALRHITRLQLLDKYSGMQAMREKRYADESFARFSAAEKLRNRHTIAAQQAAGTLDVDGMVINNPVMGAAQSNATPPPPSLTTPPPPSTTEMTPDRLKEIKRLLQSTDAWFGYEKGKREAHKALLVNGGFGEMLGTASAKKYLAAQQQAQEQAPTINSHNLSAVGGGGGVFGRSDSSLPSHAQEGPSSAAGGGSPNAKGGGGGAESVASGGGAAAATINKSRAEILRLNKLHELQACWAALAVHYTLKLGLHDKWNSKGKDAKVLDRALGLYKEGALAVLCREAVLEAIVANEQRMQRSGGGGGGGGAFLNKAFTSPTGNNNNNKAGGVATPSSNLSTARNNATNASANNTVTNESIVAKSEALTKLQQLQNTNSAPLGGGSSPSPSTTTLNIVLPSNPVVDTLREIASLPSTGNKRKDCELARHRLFSELTACSQRCDVVARRLLNETGDELLFKGGPYLVKMKEDYNAIRDMMRANEARRV